MSPSQAAELKQLGLLVLVRTAVISDRWWSWQDDISDTINALQLLVVLAGNGSYSIVTV